MQSDLVKKLKYGIQQLGYDFNLEPFADYLDLLIKWNKVYNLTAVRDEGAMIAYHILDSLMILPWLHGERFLDVGTGAGLPGIPIAIAQPQKQITLLDSQSKKIKFLHEVKRKLSLSNIAIIQARVENYTEEHKFDTIISRAFTNLAQMTNWTQHLLAKDGIWLAMKGRYPTLELAEINYPVEVKSYTVPGVEGERCCVIIRTREKL